ncbi:ClpXP protease specificity-enhancing factor SspB [Mesobacterium sp. TK19101]|uniref:ClpXP protease specificity-enhancing factor SspB n=1 Tax=Mesobacterium hydrothermale TaxID=3111907 RepID=A0ABU6HDW4_9RHOB|nr:ClpXP protease specificity-enhancing factor SspB [Mesobacterium sp. TK19101]MEC3860181.1 ClpXP protease specificity-enhancing factor SspB [Mesobacterium sp. TK19101]
MTGSIDYGKLMHKAMRGLIQEVLAGVQADGLPGDHHFFITFDTGHPDVEIADWLSDRYPGDMTVVMQHFFEDLDVSDEGFAVTLNFGDSRERLYIPYDAIKTFVDPAVEFGLRFESQDEDDEDEDETAHDAPEEHEVKPMPEHRPVAHAKADEKDAPHKDAEIVSLDKFRK